MKKTTRSMYMLLFCKETYPAFRVDLTDLFSRCLVGRGHSIDWVMQADKTEGARMVVVSDLERVRLGSRHSLAKQANFLLDLLNDLRGIGMLCRGDYDFVQVRDKFLITPLVMVVARIRGIPFFYWLSFPYNDADLQRVAEGVHGSIIQNLFLYLRGQLRSLLLYRLIIPLSHHTFVQSERMLQDIASHGVDSAQMTPVPMGMDLTRMNAAAPQVADDPKLKGKRVLAYVGTMVRMRRIDFLFDVLAGVLLKCPETCLLLVGGASEADMDYLHRRAEEAGVAESVIFTGFVPMEQAWSYTRRADICLSPFRPNPILDSTTPTKIIEAFAWSRPVVANQHPDQSRVIEESGGGLAVDYEVHAFVQAVLTLLSDPVQAEEMGKKGLNYVRTHRDYAILANMLEQRYLKLMERT